MSIGFSEKKVAEIDIIIAELASNLVKHGGGGSLLVKPVYENGIAGMEIISTRLPFDLDAEKGLSGDIGTERPDEIPRFSIVAAKKVGA